MIFIRGMLFFIFIVLSVFCHSQINYGTIIYERKTNLYKKFKGWDDVRYWIKESDKSKVEFFVLYFDDSLSCFKPQDSNLKDQTDWTTSKNTVYQNFKTQRRLSIKEIWGEKLYVEDSMLIRKWKITDNKRNICSYSCRKAIWEVNDSMRIYAWYCDDIRINTGPESFYGLPGAILGLATEDGGVIYFAKTIELLKPKQELLLPQKTKKKIYTTPELRAKLEKDFGKEKWGKALLHEAFDVW